MLAASSPHVIMIRAIHCGALILIASFPVRIAVMGTQAWLAFSTWLSSFV